MNMNMIFAAAGFLICTTLVIAALSGKKNLTGSLPKMTFAPWILYVTLALATLGFLWWLYKSNLTITKVSAWVWEHLIFTLVVTAIATAFSDRLFLSKKMWWIPAAIVAGLIATHWINSPSSTPKSQAPLTFSMPPGGRTVLIPANRKHVVMDGDNFLLHSVYRDGHECASNERCKDGPLAGVYATNLDTVHSNTVTVSYK